MRVNKVVFLASELNGGTNILKPAYIDITSNDILVQGGKVVEKPSSSTNYDTPSPYNQPNNPYYEVIRKYPLTMLVLNDSGANVEIALISNENEESDFLLNPNNYFFKLPMNGYIGANSRIGRAYKVCARKESSNCSSNLRIDFVNHVGTIKITS